MPAHDVEVTGSYSVNSYILTYKIDGEVFKAVELSYGESVTPEEVPEKEGHTFSGWTGLPETMPAHDVEVTGSYPLIHIHLHTRLTVRYSKQSNYPMARL